MGEAIQVAHQATQRCSNYMDELVQWLQERFNYDQPGSRRRKQWSAPAGATKTQTSGKGPRPATDVHWTKRALSPRPPKNCAANLVYLDSVVELAMHRRIVLYLFLLEPLTEPTQHHVQYQVSVEDKRPCGAVREAAPYQILRAQHIIERLMPFLEQEAAATLQDAHSMLFQWTTALWGEPITLADEGHGADTGGNLPPTQEQLHMAEDGDSAVDTVPFSPPEARPRQRRDWRDGGGTSSSTEPEEGSGESHRRRRLHAAASSPGRCLRGVSVASLV